MVVLYLLSLLLPVSGTVIDLLYEKYKKKKLPLWVKPGLISLAVLTGIVNFVVLYSSYSTQTEKDLADLKLKMEHHDQLLDEIHRNSFPLDDIRLQLYLKIDTGSFISKNYISKSRDLYFKGEKGGTKFYNKNFLKDKCEVHPEICDLFTMGRFDITIRSNDSSYIHLYTGQPAYYEKAWYGQDINWETNEVTIDIHDPDPDIANATTHFSSFLDLYNAEVEIQPTIAYRVGKRKYPLFFDITEIKIFDMKGHEVRCFFFTRDTQDTLFTYFKGRFSPNPITIKKKI